MPKNKPDVYLPLHWVKTLPEQTNLLEGVSPEQVRILCEAQYDEAARQDALNRCPNLVRLVAYVNSIGNNELRTDTLCNIDAISLLQVWSKNKQVYKLDSDFISELINTKTISVTKNGWDYLPYSTFYVDLSENYDLCQRIIGKGLFIRVEKGKTSNLDAATRRKEMVHSAEAYVIHVVKVTDDLFFRDLFAFDNENSETDVDELNLQNSVLIYKSEGAGTSEYHVDANNSDIDGKLYRVLIAQILTYLSSVSPDIEENEETKKTYKQPAQGAAPKNRFSEIRKWDIGVRFGSAFRKWKSGQSKSPSANTTTGEKAKMRPHSRRAHWSHFWYGSGENKERRPKWVDSYFVNTDEQEISVVIHNVKNEK